MRYQLSCSNLILTFNKFNHCIANLPWRKSVSSSLQFSMNDLFLLLSSQWLFDNHLEFFGSLANDTISRAKLPILITSLSFPHALKSFGEPDTTPEAKIAVLQEPFIKGIVNEMVQGKKIYTPYHLHDHWVVVCIDNGAQKVSYGKDDQHSIQSHEKR